MIIVEKRYDLRLRIDYRCGDSYADIYDNFLKEFMYYDYESSPLFNHDYSMDSKMAFVHQLNKEWKAYTDNLSCFLTSTGQLQGKPD